MMIRAVNSDTELVLSFNAPVTLSGAKYSIATTVPDTISDAARTMSANQGYIVYFPCNAAVDDRHRTGGN